jgi:hypothetical protein
MYTQDELITHAKRHADAKAKCYAMAASYLFMLAIMMGMDWWTTGRITWSIWPAFGFAMALASQCNKVWLGNDALKDKLVSREIERLQRNERKS